MSDSKTITAYKGFDQDMRCRGFQFEIGKTYEHAGKVKLCSSGFHSCENPLDVLSYYFLTDSKFALVEANGIIKREDNNDTKIASSKITIKAELSIGQLIKASIDWTLNGWFRDAISEIKESSWAKLASSGDGAKLASSGDWAKLASSGDGAKLASSGDWAQLASSGNWAQLASSGYGAQLASSGNGAKLASSGDGAQLASSGNGAKLASSGDGAKLASSGYGAQLASSGNGAQLASSGNGAKLASSGDGAQLASSGNWAQLASSGNWAKLVSSGYGAQLDQTENPGVLCAIERKAKIKASLGSLVALVHYGSDGTPLNFVSGKIGESGLKPDVWYTLDSTGLFVEAQ